MEDEEAYEWQDSDEEERPREDEVPQCNQYDENGYTMARFEPYPTPPETPPQALLSAAFSASTPAPNEKGNSTAKATWEYAFLAGTVVKKLYYAESEPDEETAASQITYQTQTTQPVKTADVWETLNLGEVFSVQAPIPRLLTRQEVEERLLKREKIHRNEIPQFPKNYFAVKDHPLKAQFRQVLDVIWVYA